MALKQKQYRNLGEAAFSDPESSSVEMSSEPQSDNEASSPNPPEEDFRETLERERKRLLEQNQALEEYSQSMIDELHRLLALCIVLGKKGS